MLLEWLVLRRVRAFLVTTEISLTTAKHLWLAYEAIIVT